jgi:TonB family protein
MNSLTPWPQFIIALVVISVSCSKLFASEPSTDFKRYVTSVHIPDYPPAARDRGLTGSGLALLEINSNTGEVKRVTITQSTGQDILDKSATSAYRRWRFVPHTISSAEVPIVFRNFGALDPTLLGRSNGPAIYAPPPDYPEETTPRNLSVSGVVLLQIDQRVGTVTSARMERSTGHKELDDAILYAYRQWLFRPGTVSKMRIPVKYVTERLKY